MPMLSLVLIISSLYTSALLSYLPGILKGKKDARSAQPLLVTLTIEMAMCCIAFLLSHCTDPGKVPDAFPWNPKAKQTEGDTTRKSLGIERKLDGRRRYCRFCGKFKPDRSHHCRVLGKCVLEMDHFCPWINNTVGFLNHKYFVLLLLYGVAAMITYDVLMFDKFRAAVSHTLTSADAIIVLVWFFAVMLTVVVFAFLVFHIYLISFGFTTIEFCEKYRAPDSKVYKANGAMVKDVYSKSLFDKGVWRNFKHVLGPNPLLWLVPARIGMSDDGTSIEPRWDAALDVDAAAHGRASHPPTLKQP